MQGTEATYKGSCHCGKVTFELVSDLKPALRCNCSICKRKSAVMVTAKEGSFRITGGEEHLTLYQFNTNVARHYFCKVCGIYTVITSYSIHYTKLYEYVDGREDNFQAAPAETRYL